MKTTYQSYRRSGWRDRVPQLAVLLALLFGLLPLLLAAVAAYGGTVVVNGDNSILSGPPPGPCAGANVPANYIGGADAYGRPVPPADLPGGPTVRLPDNTVFAEVDTGRHGSGAGVPVEVRGLRAALAAPDGCATYIANQRRHRRR